MTRVTIEKLVLNGQGLGRADNKVILAWNALPGEEVEVVKNKRSYAEGVARHVIPPSPDRIEPEEGHFLACSPRQILSWAQEHPWKERVA
jgi:tRNA/tmRNA/rRNA uracil-C5-methylase (TrmA/RlmC/RlmD family)